ncbi:MAG TPA: nucleoside triphosphate pyrophosphohydrolase [Gammaproteobacteria bacterium]
MKKLLDVMAALRDPESGCPWDIKQSFASLIPYTLEEAYEVADAIEQGDLQGLKYELGDLLFQVVFYAQIARELSLFEFDDVVDAISEKLVRRHPHVFAGQAFNNETELHQAWEQHKAEERDAQAIEQSGAEQASVLAGVAAALPALKRAQKLQKRAARSGFDWPEVAPVLDKLQEEINEVREAVQQQDQAAMFEEMGDLLFSVVNLARHLEVDAEEALRAGNRKFISRFSHIEQSLQQAGESLEQQDLQTLESLWQAAKQQEKADTNQS